MANDSIQTSQSVELFDQDSLQASFEAARGQAAFEMAHEDRNDETAHEDRNDETALEDRNDGICRECHVGNCGKCSGYCDCPHPFAVIGRAIVELEGSLQRTNELLRKLERPERTTEPVVRTAPENAAPVTPHTTVPAKARRGLGRKKSYR
jgi:hypothetical protein